MGSPCDRVLVVEDDPDLALLISETLEELGFDVHVASDGVAALAMLDREDPAVLLVDVTLQRQDGLVLASYARGHCSGRLAVVAMSGGRGEDLHERASAAGCDAVLLKPFSIHQLSDAVQRARVLRQRV